MQRTFTVRKTCVKRAFWNSSFHPPIGIYEVYTNYVAFHPSKWDPRKTDGQTAFHFAPHIGIQVRQTDGQTAFHFAPPIGIQVRQTDGQTTFCYTTYFSIQLRQAHKETTFHFIPLIVIKVRRTYIVEFHYSCWRFRKTETEKLRFISFL